MGFENIKYIIKCVTLDDTKAKSTSGLFVLFIKFLSMLLHNAINMISEFKLDTMKN